MKNLLYKFLSILIGLGIGLLLGEIFCRIHLFGADAFSYKKMQSIRQLAFTGYVQEAEYQKVFCELKPNVEGAFKRYPFTTNSQGLRDKEYSIQKPEHTIRGVVIGDSFTMGSGVKEADIYHSILEDELAALNDNENTIELINFGVSGYNLLNYLGVMEHKIRAYSPDFILIGFCANNDYFTPRKKHLNGNYRKRSPEELPNPFFQSFLRKVIESQLGLSPIPPKHRDVIGDEEIDFISSMFQEFAQQSTQLNIPIFINYLSLHPDKGNFPIIKGLAEENNLHFIDSFDKIDTSSPRQYFVSFLDKHPNRKANALFAKSVLEYQPFRDITIDSE